MKIDKQQLIQLRMQGKTISECAKVFDCIPETVRKMCRKLESEGLLPTTVTAKSADYIAEKHLQTDPVEPQTQTVSEYLYEEEAQETSKRAEDTDVPTTVEDTAVESVENAPVRRLPNSVIPRKMWLAERRDDLRRAICEFACEKMRIDPAWVEEYNELIEKE